MRIENTLKFFAIFTFGVLLDYGFRPISAANASCDCLPGMSRSQCNAFQLRCEAQGGGGNGGSSKKKSGRDGVERGTTANPQKGNAPGYQWVFYKMNYQGECSICRFKRCGGGYCNAANAGKLKACKVLGTKDNRKVFRCKKR